MSFQATPLNVTTMLVVVLAGVALFLLMRGRHESNMPLIFYSAAVMLVTSSDRSVNSYLLYTGLAFALLLRFEFMSKGFAKFMSVLCVATISLISLQFLDQIFGDGTMFS